jgi:hypothetical protein
MTVPTIAHQPVESSSLSSIGYLAACGILEIEFVGGAIYRYEGIGQEVYERLVASDSKGSFFNREIRSRYRFKRVA